MLESGLSRVEQRRQYVGMRLENIKQHAIPMTCILVGAAKHIVLLPLVDYVKTRNCFAGALGTVCGGICKGKRYRV